MLVVADSVQSRIEKGYVFASPGKVPPRRFFPEPLFERVFANGAMQGALDKAVSASGLGSSETVKQATGAIKGVLDIFGSQDQ